MRGKPGNTLERWEVALVKAMQARGGWNDQETLAYFTRPLRSVNHRLIAEIRTEARHKAVKPADDETLDAFLATWPDVDPETGLSVRGDELLIKAREAMIAAVHVFNGAGLTFRAELFIVTAIIGWTYLMHAWLRREGIDYRYRDDKAVLTTKQGAERYWELGKCLRHPRSPLPRSAVLNLEFLLELRHEIEHRSTDRIDEAVSAKLQACCLNFNQAIKTLFGAQYALERRLPIALQFVIYGADQRALLKRQRDLPANIEAMMDAFHAGLTPEEQADPAFRYKVAFIPMTGTRASSADEAIQFVKPESAEGREIAHVLLKEVDKRRYTEGDIVRMMKAEGYRRFSSKKHQDFAKARGARDPKLGFGSPGLYRGQWGWFDSWIAEVRQHCADHAVEWK